MEYIDLVKIILLEKVESLHFLSECGGTALLENVVDYTDRGSLSIKQELMI